MDVGEDEGAHDFLPIKAAIFKFSLLIRFCGRIAVVTSRKYMINMDL